MNWQVTFVYLFNKNRERSSSFQARMCENRQRKRDQLEWMFTCGKKKWSWLQMYKKRIEKRHLLSKWSYIVALVCCCFYFRLLVRFQFFFFSFLTLYHTFFIACPSKKILYYSKANGFCYMVFFPLIYWKRWAENHNFKWHFWSL